MRLSRRVKVEIHEIPAFQGTYSLSFLRYQASFKAETVSSRPALGKDSRGGKGSMWTHTYSLANNRCCIIHVYDASNLSQHCHQTMGCGRAKIAISKNRVNHSKISLGNDDMIISYSH